MDERSVARREENTHLVPQGSPSFPAQTGIPQQQPPPGAQTPPIIYPSITLPTQKGIPQWVWGVGIVLLQSLVGVLLLISTDVSKSVGLCLALQAVVALSYLLVPKFRSQFLLILLAYYPTYYLTFWLLHWLIQQIF